MIACHIKYLSVAKIKIKLKAKMGLRSEKLKIMKKGLKLYISIEEI